MRTPCGLLLVVLAACAHVGPHGGSVDDAQRVCDTFLHGLRWQGMRNSAAVVRRARRPEFQAAIDDGKLEDHLKVTEYELKEVERAPDGLTAVANGEISWYVEPSVTVQKETFHIHLVWLTDTWMISWIEKGPIPIPETPPEADAGPPAPAT